jgi:hypothetical protein
VKNSKPSRQKEYLEGYSETPEAQANRLATEHPQRRAQIFSIRESDLLKLTSGNNAC